MGWDSFYNNSVFFATLYRMLSRQRRRRRCRRRRRRRRQYLKSKNCSSWSAAAANGMIFWVKDKNWTDFTA